MRTKLGIGLVLAVAAAVVGCGKKETPTGGGPVGKVVDVSMTAENTFVPATVTIAAGDTVRWTNDDPEVKHTATRKEAPAFDSGMLDPGRTYSFTFPSASPPEGFAYVCTPHARMGMHGVVIVR